MKKSKKEFQTLYRSDINRLEWNDRFAKKLSYYHRKCQTCNNPLLRVIYRLRFKQIRIKNGIEISYDSKIGKGLKLVHPYNITINSMAVIGDNVTLFKGVTIGQEFRGSRAGTPTIGNCVWIGPNATVVGKITIGNDVLIAPNAFVNCDIPDHSIVIGNPCIIKNQDHATKDYIKHIS